MSSGQFQEMTTPDLAGAKESVVAALAEVIKGFGSDRVCRVLDGQGGVWIEISDIELGSPYAQEQTFAICLLPFNLPAADIYPLYLRHDLSRLDGGALGEGFTVTALQWPGDPEPRPVTHVSRRTRGGGFNLQNPRQKIDKVLDWVRTR
jgi:hypothetical protein